MLGTRPTYGARSRRAMRALWLLVVVIVALGCGMTRRDTTTAAATTVAAGSRSAGLEQYSEQAEEIVQRMPLAVRAGQLVMTAVPGRALASGDARALRAAHVGGVIVFSENVRSTAQLRRLTSAIHDLGWRGSAGDAATLIAVDQEGGTVRRLPHSPPFSSARDMGRSTSASGTERSGEATGAALAGVGIDMDLAPVADVDSGAAHVMRGRSFGSNPDRVARHVAAFVRGLDHAGAAAAVKHFPGLGAAPVNSDDALARIPRGLRQLERIDGVPFERAVAARVDAVMVSHGIYTAVDRIRPASVSPAIYRRLRGTVKFDGVAITDSLHAAGFGGRVPGGATRTPVGGCVEAVRAGADIVLLTGTVREAVACQRLLVQAARSDGAFKERVRESAIRVVKLKVRRGLASV